EKVSHASVSTNVSNAWSFGRYNHLIAWLGEVVELAGPHAQFSLNKDLEVWTENDAITSGAYELNIGYWRDIYNENDTSDTVWEILASLLKQTISPMWIAWKNMQNGTKVM
ncbi:MAG: hypothetical protein KAT65_03095, partial [Methanophagales archaeon]|nr:hypothetical protein [Methanophagales archaeon]